MGGEVPRHDALGLEETPLEVAVAALPMIAEEKCIGRKRGFPTEHDAGERSGRAGHAHLHPGRRGDEIHRHAVGRKPRVMAGSGDETRIALLDEHARRERAEVSDHGRTSDRARGSGRGTAWERCADKE